MSSRRIQKVASSLRVEIANLLLTETSDPRLVSVSVTEVQLSGDLREAKVFFTGVAESKKEVDTILAKAVPFFRKRLAENLSLRHVPQLTFVRDTHAEEVHHLFSVLNNLNSTPAQGTR